MEVIKSTSGRAKHSLFLFLFFLSLTFVSAKISYPNLGSTEYDYHLGDGLFTPLNIDAGVTGTVETDVPSTFPLIGDMNNDGIDEILTFDGNSILVYTGKELSFVTGFSMFGAIRGHPILFDIDADSSLELLIFQNNQSGFINLSIFNFNGSVLIETEYSIVSASSASGRVYDYSIACRSADNQCISIMEMGNSATNEASVSMAAIAFRNSGMTDTEILASSGANCLSTVGGMSLNDVDNDGSDEFIGNFMEWSVAGTIITSILNVNSTGNISIDQTAISDVTPNPFTGGQSCFDTDSRIKGLFSAPLIMEIDGFSNNGKEIATIVPSSANGTAYLVRVYHYDGSLFNVYPEIAFIDTPIGAKEQTIGNLFSADVLGSGIEDFCFMYVSIDTGFPEMVCNSALNPTPFGSDSVIYEPDDAFTNSYNATNPAGNLSVFVTATHTVEDVTNLQDDGHDARDILNSYGVWTVDDSTCSTGGFLCKMNLGFELPQSQVFAVQVDTEQNGFEDILMQSSQALYYLNDGFSNLHCNTPDIYSCIETDTVTIRPCIDRIWALNTSVSIQFTVNDFNLDNVGARAILYYGTTNAQDSNWSANFSSGHSFLFSNFIANLTGNNYIFRIMARDTDDATKEEILDDISFDVAEDGVTHSQCTTIGITNPETILPNATISLGNLQASSNNTITQILGDFSTYTGLGKGILWLILMLMFAGLSVYSAISMNWSAGNTLAIIGIGEILAIILGFYLGFVSGVIIITLAVVSLAIIALFVVGIFKRGSSGGG